MGSGVRSRGHLATILEAAVKLTRKQVEALVVIEASDGCVVPSWFAAKFWTETWKSGGTGRRHALRRRAGGFLRRMSESGLLTEKYLDHATYEYALTRVAREALTALRFAGKLATPTKLVRKAPARPHAIDCDMDEDCTCGARTGGRS